MQLTKQVNNGYELTKRESGFSIAQRDWIMARDVRPIIPILDDYGALVSIEYGERGNVHHINMIHHVKAQQPDCDYNHPLNGLFIDREFHTSLHRDWLQPLKDEFYAYRERWRIDFDEYLKLQTWTGKRAYWVDKYDEAMNNIALINSYRFLESSNCHFPFSCKYFEDVVGLYEHVDPHFLAIYDSLTREE